MTSLRAEPYHLPAADLGRPNPLPMFRGVEDDGAVGVDASVPPEDRRHLGWRTAWRVLPHRMQDGYNRDRRPRALDSLVLENEHLRARFLPQLGGRMVSLLHLPTGRELLCRNPVFQPANLALRNAWFSGGVEWNAGQPGHHYLTCAPVFAARVEGPDGDPVLRLYEWDRVKGFPWQIDFHLPSGSPVLFARTRLVNPHDRELAQYWWTNIAVDEREDVRVLVPADSALCNPYWKAMQVAPLPAAAGRDMTYSTRAPHACDFFSRIPDGQRRWIAALDASGSGLFHTSTDRLKGRKLFCWGMGPGGRQWQEFLAEPGVAYIEVQAGLARTQMECVPMPARAEWAWTEAFGLLQADPSAVHGADWERAWRSADEAIEALLPRARVAEAHRALAAVAARAPAEVLRAGSGWGELERRRAAADGEADPLAEALPLEMGLDPEQAPWLALLERGVLPPVDRRAEPGALMAQPEWRARLEASVRRPEGDHWLAWWHLGNMRLEERDPRGARAAWERSLRHTRTGWALRNLAVLAEREGDRDAALALRREAWEAGPPAPALAVELASALVDAGRFGDALELIAGLPEPARSHERVLLAWARAALETGRLEGVERVFDHRFATIREGEVTLTDLWFAWHARLLAAREGVPVDEAIRRRARREFPPPQHIDFRMATMADEA